MRRQLSFQEEITLQLGLKREDGAGNVTQVRPANGGGIRKLLMKRSGSVNDILCLGREVFEIQEGCHAVLEHGGKVLTSFCEEGYGLFLEKKGLFPSKTKFYIRTTKGGKATDSEAIALEEVEREDPPEEIPDKHPDLVKEGNDSQNIIDVRFSAELNSRYNHSFSISCSGRQACYEAMAHHNDAPPKMPFTYQPTEDGFSVKHITVGDKHVSLDSTLNDDPNLPLMIYSPEEINGYDDDSLILGVIPRTGEVAITWYLDGEPLLKGKGHFIFYPQQPGNYQVKLELGADSAVADVTVVTRDSTKTEIKKGETKSKHSSARCQSSEFEDDPKDGTIPQATSKVSEIRKAEIKFGEEIGRGTFGVVHKATWLGTDVAVKVFKLRNLRKMQASSMQTIQNEINIHNDLRHPNIVQFLGVIWSSKDVALVSEYVLGWDMDSLIFESDITLTTDNKKNMSLQCSRGLAYIHKSNIIHRDIKPANVLVSKNFQAKLCDLGISKIKATQGATVQTAYGAVPGTPAFMSPELLVGRKQANQMTDVWSLGATLCELFAESQLWGDMDTQQIIEIMEKGKKPHVLKGNKIEKKMKEILGKCLVYEGRNRPSALQLIKLLNAYE